VTSAAGIVKTRKVAILAADRTSAKDVRATLAALEAAGVKGVVLASRLGALAGDGGTIAVDHTLVTMPSVVFDAVVIPGGEGAEALAASGEAVHFVAEAYRHAKPIAAIGEGADLLEKAGIPEPESDDDGVVLAGSAAAAMKPFLSALGRGRAWNRSAKEAVPA
jgi:catalase